MTGMEMLQEIRKMRFEETYGGWQKWCLSQEEAALILGNMYRGNMLNVNDCRGMDFVSDSTFQGRRFRILTMVDIFSRVYLRIDVNQEIKGNDIVALLEQIKSLRGVPRIIRCDNSPESVSKILDKWAYENKVELDFSRPGKPTDNAFIESFNGSLRDECLNTNWFLSLDDARDKIKA